MFKRRAISIVLSVMLVFGTIPEIAFAGETEEKVTENNLTEVAIIEKDEGSTTFLLDSGELLTILNSNNIRYRDNDGELVDYNSEIVERGEATSDSNYDVGNYEYMNKMGDIKQYFPEFFAGTPIHMEKGSSMLNISVADETREALGLTDAKINIQDEEIENNFLKKEKVKINAVYESEKAKLTYQSVPTGVNSSLLVNNISETDIVRLEIDSFGKELKENLLGGIDVYDGNDVIASISNIELFENANGDKINDVKYTIEKKENKYYLEIQIDTSKLKDIECPIYIEYSVLWKTERQAEETCVYKDKEYKNKNCNANSETGLKVSREEVLPYLKFLKINESMKNKELESGKLVCYEKRNNPKNQELIVYKSKYNCDTSKNEWDKLNPKEKTTARLSKAELQSRAKTTGEDKNKIEFDITGYLSGSVGNDNGFLIYTYSDKMNSNLYGMSTLYSGKAGLYQPKVVLKCKMKAKAPKVEFSETISNTEKAIKLSYNYNKNGIIGGLLLEDIKYCIEKLSNGKWVKFREGKFKDKANKGSIELEALEDGKYRAFVYYIDGTGESEKGYTTKNLIVDRTKPMIGCLELKTCSGEAISEETFTEETNPQIVVSGISDNGKLTQDGITYALCKLGEEPVYKEANFVEYSEASANCILSLAKAETEIDSGEYEIYVRVKDRAGNTSEKAIKYRKDNEDPTGEIIIRDNKTGEEIEELKNIVSVTLDIDGTGSKLKRTKAELYSISGEAEELIDGNLSGYITKPANFELDSTKYENGKYEIRLELQDEMSREKLISKQFSIKNALPAPVLGYTSVGSGKTVFAYSFGEYASKISKVEYKTDKGKYTETSANTHFIEITDNAEGTHKITIRGIDREGVATKAATLTYVADFGIPEAVISRIERGEIIGAVNDIGIKEWQIYYREKGTEKYLETGISGDSNKEGRLGVIDVKRLGLESGKTYDIKLEVTDAVENKAESLAEFLYDKNTRHKEEKKAGIRIVRPVESEGYEADTFEMPNKEKAIEAVRIDKKPLSPNTKWYIDNKSTATGNIATIDFSKYGSSKEHKIVAALEDGENRLYSQDVTVNNNILEYELENETKKQSFKSNRETKLEKTITSGADIVSFRVIAENTEGEIKINVSSMESDTLAGLLFGKGQSKEIVVESGKTVYISDILGKISTNEIGLSYSSKILGGKLIVELDTIGEEKFILDSLSNNIPEEVTTKARTDGRTYVYWKRNKNASNGITYNVYRSDEKDFKISKDTLIATEIKGGYYSDINIDEEGDTTYYYRITAVKTIGYKIKEESPPTVAVQGDKLAYNETTKRIGLADYWQYQSFETQAGTGNIEESEGNLAYSVHDFDFSAENMEVSLARTYNSQSEEIGIFGLGWSDSFNLQLLNVHKEGSSTNNFVFRDGSGNFTRFIKSKKGDYYISSHGEFMKLSEAKDTENTCEISIKDRKIRIKIKYIIHTNDNIDYGFNDGGQLVLITEPNGSCIVPEYNLDTGFIQSIITSEGLKIEYVYTENDPEADFLTIKEVKLPDGGSRKYKYNRTLNGKGSLLTEVIEQGKDGIERVYKYGYKDNGLNEIIDAEGNKYKVDYDTEKRVEKIAYPNKEGYTLSYDGNTTTINNFINNKEVVSSTVSEFENNTGYCISNTDIYGKRINYEYTDGICTEEKYAIRPASINEDDKIVAGTETTKTNKSKINEETRAEKNITEDDGTYTKKEYFDEENELISKIVTYDAKGNEIEHNEFEYNEYGQEVYDYDAILDRTEITVYDGKGEIKYEAIYQGKVKKMRGEKDRVKIGATSIETLFERIKSRLNDKIQESKDNSQETYEKYGGEIITNTLISKTESSVIYGEELSKTETSIEYEDGIKTETITKYDKLGNEKYEEIKVGDKVASTEEIIYDGFGRVTEIKTTEDGVVSDSINTYDLNDNLLSCQVTVTKDGETETEVDKYTYDNIGRQTREEINDNGEITSTTESYEYSDVLVYDTNSGKKEYKNVLVDTLTDQDGYIFSQQYISAAGDLVREKSGSVYTDYVYDDFGTNTAVYVAGEDPENTDGMLTMYIINADGYTTDVVRNPEKTEEGYRVGENSLRQSTEYDKFGRVISNTDAEGNKTSYTYDKKNQLTSVTMPGGETTKYEYREVMRKGVYETIATVIDAKNRRSETAVDESGNLRYVKDYGDGSIKPIYTEYNYDDQGRCREEIEAKGNIKRYTYDKDNNIKTITYLNKDGKETTKTNYKYNLNGCIIKEETSQLQNDTMQFTNGTYYEYDNQGNLVRVSNVIGGEASGIAAIDAHAINYKYDREGKLTSVKYGFRKDGINEIKYTYDKEKRISKVSNVTGLRNVTLRSYSYDEFGRIAKISDSYNLNNTSSIIDRAYSYDELSRIKNIKYADNKKKETIENYTFAYNRNGNLTSKYVTRAYGKDKQIEINYDYDQNGRLVKSKRNGVVNTYKYDAVGNRTEAIKNDTTTKYTYNSLNQLTGEVSELDDNVIADKKYTYDANGNQISSIDSITKEKISMEYNEMDMMTTYTKSKDNTEIVHQENLYDTCGQRIRKTDSKDGISKTRNYYYDGSSVISTTDENGIETSFNLIAPDGIIGTVRTVNENENFYLYNRDDLGSTTNILNDQGEIAANYDYDDYGELIEDESDTTFDNEILYTGQIYDESTGLYYYNARFYDSSVGSFTTQDTYRGNLNDPLSLNYYGYCAGDPINYTDPTGHKSLWSKIKSGAKKAVKTVVKTAKKVGKTVAKTVKKACKTVTKVAKKAGKAVAKAAKKAGKAVAKSAKTKLAGKNLLGAAANLKSAYDIGKNTYDGIQADRANGESMEKITADAMTNIEFGVGIAVATSVIGYGITLACPTLAIPVMIGEVILSDKLSKWANQYKDSFSNNIIANGPKKGRDCFGYQGNW